MRKMMLHPTSGRVGYDNTTPDRRRERSRMMNETSGRDGYEPAAPVRTRMLNESSGRTGYSNTRPDTRSMIHDGVSCDGCGSRGRGEYIRGVRYKCSTCPNYDLCQSCMDTYDCSSDYLPIDREADDGEVEVSLHPRDHYFLRIARPINRQAPPALLNRDNWCHHVECAECLNPRIVGYRYFCTSCGTSYCETCEQKGLPRTLASTPHTQDHNLLKMGRPLETGHADSRMAHK